jgi:hypothetical protein
MQPNADPRRLLPIMPHFRSDGAPHVPLSPHKGLRNATILYEAIKSERGNTVLRADFDLAGKPRAIFAPGEKKDIAKLYATSPIKARNLDAERHELANILSSIAHAAETCADMDQHALCAAALIKKVIKCASEAKRDIHLQEIREPLRTISNTYKRIALKNSLAQYKFLNKQTSRIQNKRFDQFSAISHASFTKLVDALKPESAPRHAVNTTMAVYSMKHFIRQYLMKKDINSLSFNGYLRGAQIPEDVHFFAKRWMAISGPTRTAQRIQFDIHSWSKELDAICPLIIKAYRRQARVDTAAEAHPKEERLIFQRPIPVGMPELPPTPEKPDPLPPSIPASSALVPKTPAARTVSVAQSAHEIALNSLSRQDLDRSISDASFAAPSQAEIQETALGRPEGSMLITSPFQSNASVDGLLINDIEALLRSNSSFVGPVPTAEYQPISLPVSKGEDGVDSDQISDASGLYQFPKQAVNASSGLSSGSLALTKSSSHSTSSEILTVSTTEVLSSEESMSPEKQTSAPLPTLTLNLELSEDTDHDDEISH